MGSLITAGLSTVLEGLRDWVENINKAPDVGQRGVMGVYRELNKDDFYDVTYDGWTYMYKLQDMGDETMRRIIVLQSNEGKIGEHSEKDLKERIGTCLGVFIDIGNDIPSVDFRDHDKITITQDFMVFHSVDIREVKGASKMVGSTRHDL